MKQCLPGVLHLLKQSIRLENVDDADEEQQPLALVIGSSDGAGTETKTEKNEFKITFRDLHFLNTYGSDSSSS